MWGAEKSGSGLWQRGAINPFHTIFPMKIAPSWGNISPILESLTYQHWSMCWWHQDLTTGTFSTWSSTWRLSGTAVSMESRGPPSGRGLAVWLCWAAVEAKFKGLILTFKALCGWHAAKRGSGFSVVVVEHWNSLPLELRSLPFLLAIQWILVLF